jgi:hypothetical protein
MLYMPMLPLPLSGPRRLHFTVREISGWHDRRRFVRFAANVYRGDPYWTPSVISDRSSALDQKKNPALADLQPGLFMAESRTLDQVVGTIAVWADGHAVTDHAARRVGSFGLFEVVNEEDVVSSLLEAAEIWVREHLSGANGLGGPMDLDPCRSPGLLVDGYNHRPAALMPYNPPYYPELIETAGYEPSAELLAYQLDLSALQDSHSAGVARLQTETLSVQANQDLVVRDVNEEPDWQTILPGAGQGLQDTAWHVGPESTGVTSPELITRLKRIAVWQPSATTLVARTAEGGDALAFGVAVPNTRGSALVALGWRMLSRWSGHSHAGHRVASGMARRAGIHLLPVMVRADCKGRGLEGFLFAELLTRAAHQGYARAEISPLSTGDPTVSGMLAALGANPYKAYHIYEKRF